MNQLPILIKREFWEHRNVFLVLPAATVAFSLLMYVFFGLAGIGDNVSVNIEAEGDVEFIEDIMQVDSAYEYALLQMAERHPEERARGLQIGMLSISGLMFFVAWLVIFFYLLSSLYSDRKDRSILFWKSMPVSDAMTVLAKLLTALVCVPLIYLVGAMIVQLVGLIILTVTSFGTDVSAWEVIWKPAAYPIFVFKMLLAIIFLALWHLPLFGWLLTASAFARSVPVVWALAIPSGLMIAETILTRQSRLSAWIGDHSVPFRLVEDGRILENMQTHAVSLEMLSAIVVGAAFVAAAIWLRGKADEI